MVDETSAQRPELWGGVECTVNRVGDCYHDQLRRSGHLERLEDIERFAGLGLRALRVPVLWERSSSLAGDSSLEWAAPMLQRMQQHGLRAIAGLVHHGSGPRTTSLLDPGFAPGLVRHAAAVARRFPHIIDYTPVNEPLTTARFSALYGHWYPHARSTSAFLRALVNQCRATQDAMRAIRDVQPAARLIQTEDIGTVRSTPALAHQAAYENHRRYLSLDLLCGRVDTHHPLYDHLRAHGITDEDLAPFLNDPCPPDVIGINYYFTSDRYLDERLSRYPPWSHGDNGREAYADIDAGHADGVGLVGHREVLRGVWERYGLPLALTEVHAGCTREEQLRWFQEAWQAACELRAAGVPVQAVTAWALLGSFDWSSLACRDAGVYETGVYDLRGSHPRPTAIAHMVERLAHTGRYHHPVLDSPGWWRRRAHLNASRHAPRARPILITGGHGTLGSAFARACDARGLACVAADRHEFDVTDAERIADMLETLRPWAVVNVAGTGSPDAAEAHPEHCRRVHTQGPVLLALACKQRNIRLLTFSSDQVFDGRQEQPYLETDPVSPLSVYGACQAEAERLVLDVNDDAFVVRSGAYFGTACTRDLVLRALTTLAHGQPMYSAAAQLCSPTFVPHLVDVSLDLLLDGARGRWHLATRGQDTWLGLMRRVAEAIGLSGEVVAGTYAAAVSRAPSPGYSVLGSVHGSFMPTLEEALERYVREPELLTLCAARP